MTSLPASAVLACWLNAWLTSRENTDAVITGCSQPGVAEFTGPEPGTRLAPALFLGELRRWGVRRVSTALPAPGDPLGLGGPAGFNADALDSCEGVVLHGADLGMVPSQAGDIITWRVTEARPPSYLPSVAEADQALRSTMSQTADSLAELDVAAWQPDIVDALLELRRPGDDAPPPPFASPRAARLAQDASRAVSIVALATRDDGGAISVAEALQRSTALQPLDRAARAAMVAATSSLDGR